MEGPKDTIMMVADNLKTEIFYQVLRESPHDQGCQMIKAVVSD